ncbi:uroporphyrinogen decarboxylase [Balneolaceae bacterium ANBcel3]|nr:uroporphyrinogen decarboxylase [Balneolaceae bacterium ANBcel3]
MLKNDLYLRALEGKPVKRPPVWMMRQAGRYLPSYLKLQEKYDFFTRCETPELVAEITCLPIDELEPDAAILFSDILVVPRAMGFPIEIVSGSGPVFGKTITKPEEAFHFDALQALESLDYVMQGIKATLQKLENRVPLIGFSGAPWTLFCYMIEGKGSRDFSKAKAFCYQHPEAAAHVLEVLTDIVIAYLKEQIRSGVHAVQVFDSWAGLLGPEDFFTYSFPYLKRISEEVSEAPVVLFAKGAWYALEQLAWSTQASALSVDWAVKPEYARKATRHGITLQGNFDPSRLLSPVSEIREKTREMIRRFGKDRYIVNLGHGILPHVPVAHAKAFIDTVKTYGEAS